MQKDLEQGAEFFRRKVLLVKDNLDEIGKVSLPRVCVLACRLMQSSMHYLPLAWKVKAARLLSMHAAKNAGME